MAVTITYEAKELTENGEMKKQDKKYTTSQEEVKSINPMENKVAIHLEEQTLLIPFGRIYELKIDLDQQTIQQMEN